MSLSPLLRRPFQSRKCKLLLCSFWISLTIWLLPQYLSGPQMYSRTTLASLTDWTPGQTGVVWRSANVSQHEKENRILQVITQRNKDQIVRNLELYGPITNDTIVIVIQTNIRKMYLQAMIDSLRDSRYIEETLLVFSHGSYDEDMNAVVEDIKFARVVQIFFPFSLQTHSNTFPGFSPGDCPYPPPKSEFGKSCFGKERDFKKLQVKHHWWWKVNFVFNHLRITQNFQGLVLLLEEDHYVFPDIIHMLKLMKKIAEVECPDCNVFGVGQNPAWRGIRDFQGRSDQVSVQQWNNMGFAFSRKFWQGLNQPKCQDMFCEYDDYNWDFTLAYLSHKCLPQEIKPLTVISPRVFHIGDCGMHFHENQCEKSLSEVRKLQDTVAPFLFPPHLKVLFKDTRQMKIDGHYGGWNDPRDIQLCKDISRNQQY